MIVYRVKAEKGFKDGNVFPRALGVGEVVDVDEQTFIKMQKSDPDSIKLVQKLVPNPRKKSARKSGDKEEA